MTPYIFDGARLAAGSAAEARERAERLGFRWSDPPQDSRGEFGIIHFQRGGIAWGPEAQQDFAGLSASRVQPAIAKRWYLLCYAMPAFHPMWSEPRAEHPNAALAIVGVIGLAGDLDAAVHSVATDKDWLFARESFVRDLGARSRESSFGLGGFVRLLAPAAADAPCVAWLAPGAGRWIGVVIESESLPATAAWLDAHHVAYRWVNRHEEALQIPPEETGGVLFEFVLRGWRPRA